MLNDYTDFIQWCFMNNIRDENISIFKFDAKPETLNAFMKFIINKSDSGSFNNRIKEATFKSQGDNMNMTVLEVPKLSY